MALKDKQCAEIEAGIDELRTIAQELKDFTSDDEKLDLLAEHLGSSVFRAASVLRIIYGELLQIGNVIYDV